MTYEMMPYDEIVRAAEQIELILRPFSDQWREEIMHRQPYCLHCWRDDPSSRCQCWRDD